jgi:predicted nucleic acid-binding protein
VILADTSVWILHFRQSEPVLAGYLSDGLILMHPFVSGELACGDMNDRAALLTDLHALPAAIPASNEEVFQMLDNHRLRGQGLGWIDMHLLASSLLSECRLWTLDKKLAEAAKVMGVQLKHP